MRAAVKIKLQHGFTLIEMAIALVIIGIIANSFITVLSSRFEVTRIDNTKAELEVIRQGLLGFAFTNGRLPCPDCVLGGVNCPGGTARDGVEDQNNGACSVNVSTGNIPWRTLGMAGQGDAWSTRYRYWVDVLYADDGTGPGSIITLATPAGAGTIRERDALDVVVPLSNDVAAVIFSHGINRYGGIDASSNGDLAVPPAANVDERVNINNLPFFFSRIKTEVGAFTAGGEYDDIMVWISEVEIKASMVKAGVLP